MIGMLLMAAAVPESPAPTTPPPIVRTPAAGSRIATSPLRIDTPPRPGAALRRGMVRLSAEEAVMKAAGAAPSGVNGVFDVQIRRADRVNGILYLGTQADYRDPRNLVITIAPPAERALQAVFGSDLKQLVGQKLLVAGQARKTRIDFTIRGRASGKYYFQTHVRVFNAHQVERTPPAG